MNDHRKYFLSIIFLVCIGSFSFADAQTNSKKNRPNIIFILADDLGYGDVGCYGQQKIATPFIDQLAKEGMRFTQFYAGASVCAPSRAALMTGLHTGHTPVRGNREMQPEGQYPLSASVITLAMRLQQGGYQTAAFGKWGLGSPGSTGDPLNKGFSSFYGYNCQRQAHNYYPDHLWHNTQRIEFAENSEKATTYAADLIHQQAVKFLQGEHQRPFFLYLPYTLPHGDLMVPHDSTYERYVRQFGEAPKQRPEGALKFKNKAFEPHPHAAFAAMVTRLDQYVGDILAAVKQKGLAENTLIVFSSDNGPHREDGGDPDFFNSNGHLRGIKRDLYEGGIRVPFIAWQKGFVPSGTVSHQVGAFWDLYPTFLALAGIAVQEPVDGQSIVPALQGKKMKTPPHLYWEFHEQGGKQAVRQGDWKAVKLNVSKKDQPIELYNLKTDLSEKNNVANRYPQIAKQMEELIKKSHRREKEWPLLPQEADQNVSKK